MRAQPPGEGTAALSGAPCLVAWLPGHDAPPLLPPRPPCGRAHLAAGRLSPEECKAPHARKRRTSYQQESHGSIKHTGSLQTAAILAATLQTDGRGQGGRQGRQVRHHSTRFLRPVPHKLTLVRLLGTPWRLTEPQRQGPACTQPSDYAHAPSVAKSACPAARGVRPSQRALRRGGAGTDRVLSVSQGSLGRKLT